MSFKLTTSGVSFLFKSNFDENGLSPVEIKLSNREGEEIVSVAYKGEVKNLGSVILLFYYTHEQRINFLSYDWKIETIGACIGTICLGKIEPGTTDEIHRLITHYNSSHSNKIRLFEGEHIILEIQKENLKDINELDFFIKKSFEEFFSKDLASFSTSLNRIILLNYMSMILV